MRRTAAATRPLETILVAGLLLCCPLLDAEAQSANPPATAGVYGGDWLDLATEGTTDHFQPRATLRLDRAAYVAVFEVEPGVGATLLYPFGAEGQARLSGGEHVFRLGGVQQAFHRRLMLAHLEHAFAHRDPVVPYNHLVAVASTRPLELAGLLSGQIFEYAHGFAGVEEVTGALLAEVLGGRPAGTWTIARTSYLKFRNDPLLFTAGDVQTAAPFLALGTELQLLGLEADPRFPEFVTCLFGTETLAAFFHGLGAVGPDLDCRRRLQAIDVPGVELPSTIASAGGPEGRAVLDREDREALARAADAGRSLGPDADEALGRLAPELNREGDEVPLDRMRRLRSGAEGWRAAARARAERLRRLRVDMTERTRLPVATRADRPSAGREPSAGPGGASQGEVGPSTAPEVDPSDLPDEASGRD